MKPVLEYAKPEQSRSALGIAVDAIVVVVIPAVLRFLVALEYVQEPPPPGHGYMLDERARIVLGVVIVALAATWLVRMCYLLGRALRRWAH